MKWAAITQLASFRQEVRVCWNPAPDLKGPHMPTSARIIGVPALLLAALAFIVEPVMANDDRKDERSISVSASGSVPAVPDIAYISAGVVSEADTARTALTRNNEAMAKLLDGLKAAGIAAKDLQTSAINVEPRYAQPKEGRSATVNGYRVTNQVRITVRDVKKLGDILDQAITLGANQMNRIAFEVSNAERLKDDARKLAMENARRRAELYATAAGAQLGPVLRISEDVSEARPVVMGRAAMSSVPVEAGEQMLEVQVQVSYALK